MKNKIAKALMVVAMILGICIATLNFFSVQGKASFEGPEDGARKYVNGDKHCIEPGDC